MTKTFLTALTGGAGLAAALSATLAAAPAEAQAISPYLGEITPMAFNWCPEGWMPANGQILPIASYPALYSLYSNYYGGNGISTFGLPDLRTATPASRSTSWPLGSFTYLYFNTLSANNLAAHNHDFRGSSASANTTAIDNATLATFPSAASAYADPANLPNTMHSGMVQAAGANAAFDTRQPFLALNYCVSVDGVYPSRP